MSVGIITSAAFINPEMSAEFGLLPPAFLPVGNARLYRRQAALLSRLVDRVVLTLPESFVLPDHDVQLLKQLNLQVIRLPDGLSLAQSVMLAIIQSIEGDEPVILLHGDTLFLELDDFALDRVSVHAKHNPYPWAVVTDEAPLTVAPSVDGAGGRLVSGLFSFSHSLAFLKCLAAPGKDFLAALNAYGAQFSDFRAADEAGAWLDFGHLNTYYDSRRALTTQRAFNTLSIARNVVRKTSVQADKMNAEASWFEALPGDLRPYVPTYIGREGSGAATSGYQLAYEYLCPLSDLYVFGALPQISWSRILGACGDVLTRFRAHKPEAAPQSLFECLYGGKTRERFAQFAAGAGIDPAQGWRINGRPMPPVEALIAEMTARIGPPGADEIALMHGDFCLSNILFDFRRGEIKLLDPRGCVRAGRPSLYGDTRYDRAKLYHSVAGGYDLIVAGCYVLSRDGDYDLTLSVADTAEQGAIEAIYRDRICDGDPAQVDNAAAGAVLQFLSMPALHGEDPARQWAFLANAYRLYQRHFGST
jgi:hypothetical protein